MNYHNINNCDMLNGQGIRVSLWVSGCKIHCSGCQNPQTWDFCGGILFDKKAMDELLESLNHPWIKGLTLTGGNPLDSASDILNICKIVKKKYPYKDIWLYSGYNFEDIIKDPIKLETLNYIDILVDGPYIKEQRNIKKHWAGSSNQRIIDVQETLKTGNIKILDI